MKDEEERQSEIGRVGAIKGSTKLDLYTRLSKARDFIHQNYQRNLTLRELAGISCLNEFYFLRQFKKLFQYTPHQYLQMKRIQEASLLLKGNDFLITKICRQVGFSDHASFSKLFKRHVGLSPMEFRRTKP